jgi:hypothetical protein
MNIGRDKKILIATHHKTGCVWMTRIFRSIAQKYGLKMFEHAPNPEQPWDIFVEGNSQFDFDALPADLLGLHIIRDPRDVIVSGAFYREKSDESWLHEPNKQYGNMTYQQKIKSLPTVEEKMTFEMEHVGQYTIENMCRWNYQDPRFFETKYEELIADESLFIFHQVFAFLEFPSAMLPALLQIAFDNSLYSGKVQKGGHVRSGKSNQWKQYFTPRLAERFVQLFGDVLIDLGYELDNNWMSGVSKSHSWEGRPATHS